MKYTVYGFLITVGLLLGACNDQEISSGASFPDFTEQMGLQGSADVTTSGTPHLYDRQQDQMALALSEATQEYMFIGGENQIYSKAGVTQSDASSLARTDSLDGTWELIIGLNNSQILDTFDGTPYITIEVGRVEGYLGCNSGGGTLEATPRGAQGQGFDIDFSGALFTKRACPDPFEEDELLQTLEEVNRARLFGPYLLFLRYDQGGLKFLLWRQTATPPTQ